MSFAMAAMAQTSTSTTYTTDSNLPVVGLASTETAQVNVVNLAPASSSGTAASCTGTIAFYNSTGSAIGSATSFTVGSGQILSASPAFSRVGVSGTRTSIRSVITVNETSGSGVPCALASSLETFDTSGGITHVHIDQGGFGGHSAAGGSVSHNSDNAAGKVWGIHNCEPAFERPQPAEAAAARIGCPTGLGFRP